MIRARTHDNADELLESSEEELELLGRIQRYVRAQ